MRELSSPLSFFYKFIFLFLWFAGIGYAARDAIFVQAAYDAKWFQYVGIWLGVSVFIFFTTGTIKRVAIEGKYLVVSNFIRAEKIELSRIGSIDGSTFLSPKLVWIKLKDNSSFGRRITFLPKHRLQSGLGKHPIIKELSEELGL